VPQLVACWPAGLARQGVLHLSQLTPSHPVLHSQVWRPARGVQLPWLWQGLPSHPVSWVQVLPDQPLPQLHLQGCHCEDGLPCDPQFNVHGGGGGGGGGFFPPSTHAGVCSTSTSSGGSQLLATAHRPHRRGARMGGGGDEGGAQRGRYG
jgi:hypothetical protein